MSCSNGWFASGASRTIDHEIQDEIRDTWAELINKEISDMMVEVCQVLLEETE